MPTEPPSTLQGVMLERERVERDLAVVLRAGRQIGDVRRLLDVYESQLKRAIAEYHAASGEDAKAEVVEGLAATASHLENVWMCAEGIATDTIAVRLHRLVEITEKHAAHLDLATVKPLPDPKSYDPSIWLDAINDSPEGAVVDIVREFEACDGALSMRLADYPSPEAWDPNHPRVLLRQIVALLADPETQKKTIAFGWMELANALDLFNANIGRHANPESFDRQLRTARAKAHRKHQ